MSPVRFIWLFLVAVASGLALPQLAGAQAPDLNQPPARASEPVVLKGSQLGSWAAPANQTAKLPMTDLFDCPEIDSRDDCAHNHYVQPEVDTGDKLGSGAPVDGIAGFRWDPARRRFVQIPFQVDEVFTRYLDNSASGFAAYSGNDQHTTYAYDREGFRYTDADPDNPCVAVPHDGVKTTADPVRGLDANDEVAFMASDAGPRAPAGAATPPGIDKNGIKEIAVGDRFVYVTKGVRPAFNASNGYVRYNRDAPKAGWFERSESSYDNYGNAAKGTYCDDNGNVVIDPKTGKPDIQRRRPRDYATVSTGRYKFRYDGRWMMTALSISPDGGKTYGPDLIDRWKARAFAQDPSSETPCCGFEEEDTHWGGSSTLLGERSGPVRAIRETWGADSGTNVIRRETFYRETLQQKSWLRVHPIPPLDGIYAQWDFNGGKVTRFYNSKNADKGVPIDGRNDEAFGNLDDPCNENYSANDTSALDQGFRSLYGSTPLCDLSEYHQSVDVFDPTFSQANTALDWAQVSGPYGTIADRYRQETPDATPGGLAQSVVAVPYYRDDSCFDDGTGTDPGPRLKPGSADEPRDGRKCWHPEDGQPNGDPRFFQGSIATHGVHLLFIADSDNARQTVPLDEVVSTQDMAMLPGEQPGAVGASFGQAWAQPVSASVRRAAGLRDRTRPHVRLTVKKRSHRRALLRWRGRDTGGSGLRAYRLQVRKGHGRWHTVLRASKRHKLRYRARRAGRYAFRVQAVDRAGNRSRWSRKRTRL